MMVLCVWHRQNARIVATIRNTYYRHSVGEGGWLRVLYKRRARIVVMVMTMMVLNFVFSLLSTRSMCLIWPFLILHSLLAQISGRKENAHIFPTSYFVLFQNYRLKWILNKIYVKMVERLARINRKILQIEMETKRKKKKIRRHKVRYEIELLLASSDFHFFLLLFGSF